MKKIVVKQEEASTLLTHEFPTSAATLKYLQQNHFELMKFITKLHYPRKSNQFIEKYFKLEVENLRNQSFEERVQYEISFLLRRECAPFLSILKASFYTFPLKNILSKFINEDITLVSVNKIKNDESLRADFVARIFNTSTSTPPIEEKFTSKNLFCGENMPNFNDAKWDFLRAFFKDDLADFESIVQENDLTDKYIDKGSLSKYLELT
jgi:hypothetical protein